jgi:hypothetical protein
MKNLAILLTVSLIAAAAAYFAFVSGGIDEMTLILESGRATVERDGHEIRVEDEQDLDEGDLIRIDGVARLRLAGDRHAFLEGRSRISVTNDHALDAHAGSVRVQSVHGDVFRVSFGDVEATATDSNFRVDQGVGSTRVGTYLGSVSLSTPGEPDLRVPQYFEAAIAVGDLPDSTRPYRFDLDDVWDSVFLDSVIEVDDELTRTASALSGQLVGGSGPSLGYFNGLAKQDVDFMRRYLKRATDELLIGFTIADNTRSGSMKRSFTRAFRLRDQGGRWGLIAAILDARTTSVVADLESIVGATGVADGSGETGEEPEFTLAAGEPSGPGAAGNGDLPSDPTDPPAEVPGDPTDPKDPKDPPEGDDCASGPECDIQEGVDELNPLDDDPSPSPDGDQPPLTDGVLGGGNGLP